VQELHGQVGDLMPFVSQRKPACRLEEADGGGFDVLGLA
jgi:hypothetical protein